MQSCYIKVLPHRGLRIKYHSFHLIKVDYQYIDMVVHTYTLLSNYNFLNSIEVNKCISYHLTKNIKLKEV